MIQWALYVERQNYKNSFYPTTSEIIQINETDYIDIEVTVPAELFDNGDPYVVIGDVPYKLRLVSASDTKRTFITVEPSEKHHKQVFYNYFGESEVSLCFDNDFIHPHTFKVDIRARRANAELAQQMIQYISSNLDDVYLLCFSKSYTSTSLNKDNESAGNRFALIKDAVDYLFTNQAKIIKDHKFNWEHEMVLSQQGQPTGPDSVHYLLSHLDQVEPSDIHTSNILINNRPYVSHQVPKEILAENSDVFENRVIYSFLFAAKQYLSNLRKNFLSELDDGVQRKMTTTDDSNEFVSFDHTLIGYKKDIIAHQLSEIAKVEKKNKFLISLYDKNLNVKLVPQLRPKMTPFVTARPHYRTSYIKINQWYLSKAPDINTENVLMGLRSLSSIYEICCLLFLNSLVSKELKIPRTLESYISYSETLPYDGELATRPKGQTNNLFLYKDLDTTISLKFEPNIYKFRQGISRPGDLIKVSKPPSSHDKAKFGEHHYCPDFVLQIDNKDWEEPLVIILDAKFQNHTNIIKYAIPSTEQKYLRDLFEVKEDFSIGMSPVKLLVLMYPHGSQSVATRLLKEHLVGEDLCIFPQTMGIKSTPSAVSRLFNTIIKAYDYHGKTQRKLLGINQPEPYNLQVIK
ncbi:hypothetical protein [Thalassotalea sp. SU-HH00458]|uniref:hypothetical protein n=1 Tax=Thalassotalea sp. SU-HH00458 TaxID=3127657 RepID=UPI003109BA04